MTKHPVTLGPDGRRLCYVCLKRPISTDRSARCSKCIEDGLRKKCLDCGELVYRKTTRCRKCNSANVQGHRWNGGRVKVNGYIKLRKSLLPEDLRDHPRMHKNGYILEHILVMEEKLGRRLLPGENVHHINGVRDDNRPENLELWVTKQPLGQRPEDLVAWAREIIDLYG